MKQRADSTVVADYLLTIKAEIEQQYGEAFAPHSKIIEDRPQQQLIGLRASLLSRRNSALALQLQLQHSAKAR